MLQCPSRAGGQPVWAFTSAPKNSFDTMFVRLETDTGLVGWGEAFSRTEDVSTPESDSDPCAAAGHRRERCRNLQDQIQARIRPAEFRTCRPDHVRHLGSRHRALDIAAKAAGRPLVDLLGGSFADEVEVYASLMRYGSPGGRRESHAPRHRAKVTATSSCMRRPIPR